MATCIRGFSNTFVPEIKSENNLQYIESDELERTWKASRRQRLKQQEDKIWQEFVREQDVLHAVQDDPYQFLEQLPAACLQELLDSELRPSREEQPTQLGEGDSARVDPAALVSFTDLTDRESELFHIYSDKEEHSGQEDNPQSGEETARTVKERDVDTSPHAPNEGEGDGNTSPCSRPLSANSKSKSTENISNMIESSIYCAKVKELRNKIQEELQAIVSTLDGINVTSIELGVLRKMCKRSAEFCGRFHRIHMYQLQRQMHTIKRHICQAPPLGKHTYYQSQMTRVVSLHQGLLQSIQVFHKSVEQTACLQESCAQLLAIVRCVRDVTAACAAVVAPNDVTPSDIYSDTMEETNAAVESAAKVYAIRVSSCIAAAQNVNTARSQKATKGIKGKKRNWVRGASKTTMDSNKANAKLSMYSLDTIRKPSRSFEYNSAASKHREANASAKAAEDKEDDKPEKKMRRPLMRDPHEGLPRRQRHQECDVTTMVQVVEVPSSHMSRASESPIRSPGIRRHPRRPSPSNRGGKKETPYSPVSPSKWKKEIGSVSPKEITQLVSPLPLKLGRSSRKEKKNKDKKNQKSARETEGQSVPVTPTFEWTPQPQWQQPPLWSPAPQPLWQPPPLPASPAAPVPQPPASAPADHQHTDSQRNSDTSERGKDQKSDGDAPGVCEVTSLLKQLCGDTGGKNDRTSGARNAQLLCINGSSPRQPSTPQLLKILEETIQKKAPKPMYGKPKRPRDIDRVRLMFNIAPGVSESIFQYRTKFLQHMLTSPLYANSAVGKPWEMIGSVSEQIIDEVLTNIAKELEIRDVIHELYLTEIQ